MTDPIVLGTGANYSYWRIQKYGSDHRIWFKNLLNGGWFEAPNEQARVVFDWLFAQAPEGRSQWRAIGINIGEPIDITKPHTTEDYNDVQTDFELIGRDWEPNNG